MSRDFWPALAALLLIVAIALSAGCASIPGPETRFTPIPTTPPITVTPQVKVVTLKTPVVTATALPATTSPVTMRTPAISGSTAVVTRSCAEQGGSMAIAGEECPGPWLSAADTFTCCSTMPSRLQQKNASVVIGPFDPVIILDDDPGSILP